MRGGCSGFDLDLGIGCIQTLTFDRDLVVMNAFLVIDDQPVGVNGEGPFSGNGQTPVFSDLEVCGAGIDRPVSCESIHAGVEGGYILRIFATPEF
jgi:hypothetical protein